MYWFDANLIEFRNESCSCSDPIHLHVLAAYLIKFFPFRKPFFEKCLRKDQNMKCAGTSEINMSATKLIGKVRKWDTEWISNLSTVMLVCDVNCENPIKTVSDEKISQLLLLDERRAAASIGPISTSFRYP